MGKIKEKLIPLKVCIFNTEVERSKKGSFPPIPEISPFFVLQILCFPAFSLVQTEGYL